MGTVRDLLRDAVRAAEEKKPLDLVALDLRGLSSVTDYFVVCSGTSDTHVRAIADSVREKLKKLGQRPFSFEGYQEGTWVLLDYVDFVIHVFHHEQRTFYGIEELWIDAKKVAIRAPVKKKPAAKKVSAKKPPAKITAAKKAPAKKPPAKKAPAKKAATKKTGAKTPGKRSTSG